MINDNNNSGNNNKFTNFLDNKYISCKVSEFQFYCDLQINLRIDWDSLECSNYADNISF